MFIKKVHFDKLIANANASDPRSKCHKRINKYKMTFDYLMGKLIYETNFQENFVILHRELWLNRYTKVGSYKCDIESLLNHQIYLKNIQNIHQGCIK